MAQPNDPSTEQTLKKVLDVLSKAFPAAGSRGAVGGGRTERNESSSSTSTDRADKVSAGKQQKIIVATARSLEKLSGAANQSANSLTGVSKQSDKVKGSFVGLNSSLSATMKSLSLSRAEIRKINFGGIAGEIEKAVAQSMGGLKAPEEKVSAGKVVSRFGDLMDNRVNPRLEKFTRVLRLTSNALVGFLRELREGAQSGDLAPQARRRKSRTPTFPSSWSLQPIDGSGTPDGTVKKGFDARKKPKVTVKPEKPKATVKPKESKKTEKPDDKDDESDEDKSLSDKIKENIKARHGEGKVLEVVTNALGLFKAMIVRAKDAGMAMLDDAFQVLAARGYGTTDSMFTLYKGSILAGMGLREFVQMMDENMIAVSRASSFGEFQKNLKVGADGLKKFGVFGEDANRLSATMMASATSIGVPQAKMQDAIAAQTASFAKLRKTTNITANEFRELTEQISSDAQVRTELSALNPADRARRQAEIIDQAAYARALNLSKTEVQKYTQSILEQRKSTVKQRFQQAGRLTQAAGMLGMDQGKVDELRKLAMNQRNLTADQRARFLELKGEVNTGIERMQQSGQPGSQFQADTIRENLETAGINDLDVAAAARAAQESGKVAKADGSATNEDVNKQLGAVSQGLGTLLTTLEGVMKNPLGALAVTLVTGLGGLALAMTGVGAAITSKIATLGAPIGTAAGNIIAKYVNRPGAGDSDTPNRGRRGPPGRGPGGRGRTRRGAGRTGAPTPTGMDDVTTSLGADGSGGDTTKPKKTVGGRVAGAGKALFGSVKGVGILGAVAGVATMASGVMNAEEAAKEENGGDGDVGKAKGEAIGDGIGTTAGAIIGGAIGSVVPVFGTAIGATLGGLLGGWAGKLIGGAAAAESAAEKMERETKKNTAEMIKARREKAGPDVITTDNLSSITQNSLQTAKAYTAPTADELAKYAESKKTPEQKAKEKAEKEAAAIKAMPQDQKNALLKKARDEVYNGSNPNANEGDVNKRFKDLLQKKAEASVVEASAAVASVATVPLPTPEVTTVTKPAAMATLVPVAPPVIATPATQAQGSVNPTAVNKKDTDAQADATSKAVAAAIQSPTNLSDPSEVLKQILEILKQSLMAENQQVELASTMLRAQSLTPYLPDKQTLVRRVMSQV